MKTYLKTLLRVFEKHITRFLSIILIVLVSVGFIAGIGGSTNKIDQSLTDYYKSERVSDLILKSKENGGFTEEQIDALAARYGTNNVNTGNSVDVRLELFGQEQLVRLYFLTDLHGGSVNKLKSVETTSFPEADAPEHIALCEEADNKLKGAELGSRFTIDFKEVVKQLAVQGGQEEPTFPPFITDEMTSITVTVAETVLSPLTFAKDGEPSYTNPADVQIPETIAGLDDLILLDNIFYLSADDVPALFRSAISPRADVYLALPNRSAFNAFSRDYRAYLDDQLAEIALLLEGSEFEAITLYDNYSFNSLHAYGEKVMLLGVVLMVAFLLITALVVQSNMTRLMDEERAQIACLKTLGYDGFRITFKYVLFALLATGIGGVGAHFVGIGLADLIYFVFNYSFAMPAMSGNVMLWFFLATFFAIVAVTFLATVLSGAKLLKEKPADLLRPRAPKSGKKVFLERIPFIWNHLSFKYKSSMRNLLRYKSRFIMTIIAVAGSMGLVLAGLALLDMCLFGNFGSPSIMGLAVIIVVFAGLLTAVVIYTLVNISISERNREIATLMVLGYHDREITGYIFRELYLNTVVGIAFGYPVGVLLMWFVFAIIDFGAIAAVSWFVWLLAPFITFAFTFLVTLMLRRKILKIDMNESLKAIE